MAKRKVELILAGDAKGALRALGDVGDAADRTGGRLNGFGVAAGAALAGAAVGAGALAVTSLQSFATFEEGMREVYTLLPGISSEAMDSMTGQVKDFANEFGVLPDEVVPALYNSLSAGVPQDNVFAFLETAQQAAKGGATDLETTVDGLSSVVNAYGADVISAQQASDQMFTAVRLGKTNFEELSGSMFQVAPIAASMGVGFGDVSAALAALTAQGTPTSVAASQMKGALAELGKEGTKASDAFAAAAGQSFPEFIASGGNLQEALQVLEQSAAGSGGSILDMFGSIEAGQAALALTGKGTDSFTAALDEMAGSAGATEQAFGTMDESVAAQLEKMRARFETLKLDIGGALAPLATELMDNLMPAIEPLIPVVQQLATSVGGVLGDAMQALLPPVMTLLDALLPIVPLFAELAGVLIDALAPVLGALMEALAPVITQLVEALKPVIEALKPAFSSLSGALVQIVEAIAPLLPAILELSLAFLPLIPPLAELIAKLVDGLLPILLPIIEATVVLTGYLAEGLTLAIGAVVEVVATFIDALVGLIDKPEETRAAFFAGIEAIKGFFGDLVGTVLGVVGDIHNSLVNGLTDAINGAIEAGGDLLGWFADLPGKVWESALAAGKNLANAFIEGINALIGAWNALDLSMSAPPWMPGIGGKSTGDMIPDLPTVPYLESGALLTAPTLFVGGESPKARAGGGELVSPVATMQRVVRDELARTGGQQLVVNLNISGPVLGDKRTFGRLISEALDEYRRSGGRPGLN